MAIFPPTNIWQYPASSWVWRYQLYEDPLVNDQRRLVIQFKNGYCAEYQAGDPAAVTQMLAMYFAPSKGKLVNNFFKRYHWPYQPVIPPP
jgi:hypothetical protein